MYFATCLLSIVLLLWWMGRDPRRSRGFVEINPRFRLFFRRLGLAQPTDFLDLQALIVSGHPDRNVARLTLGHGDEVMSVFLKREHRVPWSVRLVNLLNGFGWLSRSLRETRILQALQREGIGCPEWLAAGEDDHGRAFLLTREVAGTVELRTFLGQQGDTSVRRRLARTLGTALARLHEAGFQHPDLYAKHILIEPESLTIHILDWQRAERRLPGFRRRARDLAALQATLADDLASTRERLVCLRAYLRYPGSRKRVPTPLTEAWPDSSRRSLLGSIHASTRRLMRRRHILEKRQPAAPPRLQDWTCIHGSELCVTSTLGQTWPERPVDWLTLENQPVSPLKLARRWLPLEGDRRALLIRRRATPGLRALWNWVRRRPIASPEQRQAELLLRLHRHDIPAPNVLAMGQRWVGLGKQDSFLLTEPVANGLRLETWLMRQGHTPDGPSPAVRQRVLHHAGRLVRQLHEASCYFTGPTVAEPLVVCVVPDGDPELGLDSVEGVQASRRPQPARAQRDLERLRQSLSKTGCDSRDLDTFLSGYQGQTAVPAGGAESVGHGSGSLQSPENKPMPGGSFNHDAERPACSESLPFWQRLFGGVRRLRQRSDWPDFAGVEWSDSIMDVAVTDRFHAKQGRSVGRWILQRTTATGEVKKLAVYLKRHYELPWWSRLLAVVWPWGNWSPAMKEWEHLEWARQQGVPVPEVVAAGEFIGPWGKLQSFLAVEELHDMLPLHEAIPLASQHLDPATFRRWKRTLVIEMARLARMLHDRRYFHKDLYLCHFYIARTDTQSIPDDWRGRVFLIDLHRLAHHPWTWRIWQMKDLAQLLYSSEVAGVDTRDRLAFWREYRGPGPRTRGQSWLRRLVQLKWLRYRRHNARHKEHRPGAVASTMNGTPN